MIAVATTGIGGHDRVETCDVPFPVPGPGEVLLNILAAGVTNTQVNTSLGWSSSGATGNTSA